ncbi:TPA: LLM class flavin-dependent oxidoreductase [Candidatus Bathyarchaeota archaeon]|nr:LLM class flavin-dependent oxidoreductase [Candidatus Bathyarchaeota archaeon]
MAKFGLDLTIWPWRYKSFDEIIRISSLAEKFGLDSLWFSDHLMYTVPGQGSLEPFSSLSAVASRTERIALGTKVICASFRHPGLVAKIGVTLDIISHGRLILGIGAGWYKREFDAYGIPYEGRVSRMREAVEIIKKLWTDPSVDYEGKFFKIKGAVCSPKPFQKPHPPIWIAAEKPRMLKITAEIGDGWLTVNPKVNDFRRKLSFIQNHAAKVGRRKDMIETVCYMYASLAETSEEAWRIAELEILPERRRALNPDLSLKELGEFCLVGDPDEWIARIEDYVKTGAHHIIVKIVPLDQERLKLYAEKVISYFKDQHV